MCATGADRDRGARPDAGKAVRTLFEGDDLVTVLEADWSNLRPYAPFSLLFIDVYEPKQRGINIVAELMKPGGFVVLDDS